MCLHQRCQYVGQIESLQSSLHTATGRANHLQRANELLETQLKSLKIVVMDAERRQAAAATDAKQLSTDKDLEMKRKIHEVSELKQQVVSLATTVVLRLP